MKSQGKQNDSPQLFRAVWGKEDKIMNASCSFSSSFRTWPGFGPGLDLDLTLRKMLTTIPTKLIIEIGDRLTGCGW
jgi:hypothetical protein